MSCRTVISILSQNDGIGRHCHLGKQKLDSQLYKYFSEAELSGQKLAQLNLTGQITSFEICRLGCQRNYSLVG